MIIYPVWVSQILAHNVDAMKHRPILSYFAKWSSSFPAYVMSLESLHLNNHVLILWESTVVTRDTGVDSVSKAKEGT